MEWPAYRDKAIELSSQNEIEKPLFPRPDHLALPYMYMASL